jgi:mono/diheme cytochrome c family protein
MARRVTPALVLIVSLIALVSAGCFESNEASQTVSQAITIGTGTTATVIDPVTGKAAALTTAVPTTATTTTPSSTPASTGTTSTGTTSTGTTSTGTTATVDAAAKATFTSTCGGCHTLANAGTTGAVGPNLDDLGKSGVLTPTVVANQIANAAPPMPKALLTGAQAQAVANYVAQVAGKS